jgi:hypothetical protein
MIPPIADLPPMMQERVVCSVGAAAQYQIPANLVLAVAETEGGRPGQWVRNTNGTYDLGAMQFNTAYLRSLAKYGITPSDVLTSGCYPYQLAAWRLAGHLKNDVGDLWQRAANYHSRTPHFNAIYRNKLIAAGARWGAWLEKNFITVPASPALRHMPHQQTAYVPRHVAISQTREP